MHGIGRERFPELISVLKSQLVPCDNHEEDADNLVAQVISYGVLQLLRSDGLFDGKASPEESALIKLSRIHRRFNGIQGEDTYMRDVLDQYEEILKAFSGLSRRAELTSERLWEILTPPNDKTGRWVRAVLGAALFLVKSRNSYEGFMEGELLPKAKENEWVREVGMYFAAFVGAYSGFSHLPPSWKWPFLLKPESKWLVPLCTYTVLLQENGLSEEAKQIISLTMEEMNQAGDAWQLGNISKDV